MTSRRSRSWSSSGYASRERATIPWTKGHELAELIESLLARLDALVADGLDAIQREVPAYAGIGDRDLLADVRLSLTRHSRILMRCLQTGSNPAPEDFEFVRSNAADRAARDIPLADYLHTFRVFHRI